MDADTLTTVFRHLCGQGRCFVVDGVALPVCQRCFGLYVGAAVTGVWLLASGLWRRGLPSRRVGTAQGLLLLAAMLGGIHAIDLGPTWRVLCGLWTGHGVLSWLVGGAQHLRSASRGAAGGAPRWTGRDELQWSCVAGWLTLAALLLPIQGVLGWSAWTAIVAGGAVSLTLALSGAVIATTAWCTSNRRSSAPPTA